MAFRLGFGDFRAVYCHDDAHQIGDLPPSLDTPELELRPAGGSVVGLQVEGPSFFQEPSASRSRLILPLASPREESARFRLLIEAGVPNGPPFSDSEDIAARETLARFSVTASVRAGDEALVIEGGHGLESLLAEAAAHPAWSAGSANRLMLRISQRAGRETLTLASGESGRPARLEACYGACDPFGAPAAEQTTCRPPDPDSGPAPPGAGLGRREQCGIGFELTPALLVLVRLSRRAGKRVPRSIR